jgi:hypothetical protein
LHGRFNQAIRIDGQVLNLVDIGIALNVGGRVDAW